MAKPLAKYSLGRLLRVTPSLQLLYVSGTTARQADGTVPPFDHEFDESLVKSDSLESMAAGIQTERILTKISTIIKDASQEKHGLESLVEMTIFVKDLQRDYGAINAAYARFMNSVFVKEGLSLPARTCVEVCAMPPDERVLVEIKAVAAIQDI